MKKWCETLNAFREIVQKQAIDDIVDGWITFVPSTFPIASNVSVAPLVSVREPLMVRVLRRMVRADPAVSETFPLIVVGAVIVRFAAGTTTTFAFTTHTPFTHTKFVDEVGRVSSGHDVDDGDGDGDDDVEVDVGVVTGSSLCSNSILHAWTRVASVSTSAACGNTTTSSTKSCDTNCRSSGFTVIESGVVPIRITERLLTEGINSTDLLKFSEMTFRLKVEELTETARGSEVFGGQWPRETISLE